MGNLLERLKHMEFIISNTYNIDTTIMSWHYDAEDDAFIINCSPQFGQMYLKRDNPNFIDLYGKLKNGDTMNFVCSNWLYNLDEIIDIRDCEVLTIQGKVIGFLDLKNETQKLRFYDEIVIMGSEERKQRLLIEKENRDKIEIGKRYRIKCIKKFIDNFYEIVDFTTI